MQLALNYLYTTDSRSKFEEITGTLESFW